MEIEFGVTSTEFFTIVFDDASPLNQIFHEQREDTGSFLIRIQNLQFQRIKRKSMGSQWGNLEKSDNVRILFEDNSKPHIGSNLQRHLIR
jgi:hypothetical protein